MTSKSRILLAGEGACAILHDLLSCPDVAVRALTRNELRASVLRRLGVEMVEGDVDDCPSLRRAMRGCYGVFAVTHSLEDGKNVIKVAAGADIEQFVCAAAEGRDQLEQYARSLGLHATFVDPASPSDAAVMLLPYEETPCRSFSLQFFP